MFDIFKMLPVLCRRERREPLANLLPPRERTISRTLADPVRVQIKWSQHEERWVSGRGLFYATAIALAFMLATPATAQTKGDVVAAAFRCTQPVSAHTGLPLEFDVEAVSKPQTDRLPSLEGLTAKQYAAWIRAVEGDARIAWAIIRNHYQR